MNPQRIKLSAYKKEFLEVMPHSKYCFGRDSGENDFLRGWEEGVARKTEKENVKDI